MGCTLEKVQGKINPIGIWRKGALQYQGEQNVPTDFETPVNFCPNQIKQKQKDRLGFEIH